MKLEQFSFLYCLCSVREREGRTCCTIFSSPCLCVMMVLWADTFLYVVEKWPLVVHLHAADISHVLPSRLLLQTGMVRAICRVGVLLKYFPFLLLCRTQHSLENQTATLLKGSVLMPQSGPISPAALLLGNTDPPPKLSDTGILISLRFHFIPLHHTLQEEKMFLLPTPGVICNNPNLWKMSKWN